MLVNTTKIYQFKAKDSEIKPYTVCLGNTSKDFTINVYEKTGLNGVAKVFSIVIMVLTLAIFWISIDI